MVRLARVLVNKRRNKNYTRSTLILWKSALVICLSLFSCIVNASVYQIKVQNCKTGNANGIYGRYNDSGQLNTYNGKALYQFDNNGTTYSIYYRNNSIQWVLDKNAVNASSSGTVSNIKNSGKNHPSQGNWSKGCRLYPLSVKVQFSDHYTDVDGIYNISGTTNGLPKYERNRGTGFIYYHKKANKWVVDANQVSNSNYDGVRVFGKKKEKNVVQTTWEENALVAPIETINPKMISTLRWHACGVNTDGARCWGLNDKGQAPEFIDGFNDPSQVSAGRAHTCVLDNDGVKCWGSLNGTVVKDQNPQLVPNLSNPIQVESGDSHACAIHDDGVSCWGYNGSGQAPGTVSGLINPKQVTGGASHSCALDDAGVKCWGKNNYGQAPSQVSALNNPTQVSAGEFHTCAVDDDGVKCWGRDSNGQVTGIPNDLTNPRQVSTGYRHTCALDDDGVKCWGWNAFGQAPDLVEGLVNPVQITSGNWFSCAIDEEGVKCWGDGYTNFGQTVPPEEFVGFSSLLNESDVQEFLDKRLKFIIKDIERQNPDFDMPEILLSESRDSTNPYERTNNGLLIHFSGAIPTHERVELYRVIGLTVFESLLGRPDANLSCALTDSAFDRDSFFYTSDLLDSTAHQSDTCILYESWAEFFTESMLGKSIHHDAQNHRRELSVYHLFKELFIGVPELDTLTRPIQIMQPAIVNLEDAGEYCKVAAGSHTTTSCSAEDIPPVGKGFASHHEHCEKLVEEGDIDDETAAKYCLSFQQALELDSAPHCLITYKNGSNIATAYRHCNDASYFVLCEDINSDADIRLTAKRYPLYMSESACVLEYGRDFMAIQETTLGKRKSNVLNLLGSEEGGTGMAKSKDDSPRKMRKVSTYKSTNNKLDALNEKVSQFTDNKKLQFDFLAVHAINVGAGSCHLAQCISYDPDGDIVPQTESVLVDCGSIGRGSGDALDGDGVVAYLEDQGFYFDPSPTVIVSHGDRDHYSHIKKIMTGRLPDKVYFGGRKASYRGFKHWFTEKGDQGVTVNDGAIELSVNRNAQIHNFSECDAKVEMLVANHGGLGSTSIVKNRNSVVLDVRKGNEYSFVLPGDALGSTESKALSRFDGLSDNQLLMSSHHGAALHYSNSIEWLQGILPDYLIYSSGDRFGHPYCSTVQRGEDTVLEQHSSHEIRCGDDLATGALPYKDGPDSQNLPQKAHFSTRSSGTVISIYAIPKDSSGNLTPIHTLIRER